VSPSPIRWVNEWINERWPLSKLIRLSLDEEIAGGSSFFYTEGSAIFIIFALQAVTGILQIFFYVPTVDHAYNSLSYLRTEVPFGWLIHNLHYWGAQLMIVVVVLHMIRVFVWGAYKSPRELVWLAGVLLLLITMTFSFTGAPLAWDQSGYWDDEVGTSIAGTIPVIGGIIKRFLRGGEMMGQLTISRFFAMHTSVLPLVLVAIFGIHFVAFRVFGSTGPWDAAKRKGNGPFWPDQAHKDAVTGTCIFLLLIFLSVYVPPGYSGPVDILDITYVPKPEWNFLFVYQALKYFHGRFEAVGTVGVPAFILLLLIILPFIDRNPEKNPLRRPVAMFCGFIFTGVLIALTLIGYYSPGLAEMPGSSAAKALPASSKQPPAPSPSASSVPKQTAQPSQNERKGEAIQIFQSRGCTACHSVEGVGGKIGPAFSRGVLAAKGRAWVVDQIRNPKSHNPSSIMPSFASLPDQQVEEIVNYLVGPAQGAGSQGKGAAVTLPSPMPSPGTGEQEKVKTGTAPAEGGARTVVGDAAHIIGGSRRGAALFANYCSRCHGAKGAGGLPNPGSEDGQVPELNPIDRSLYNNDPKVFAAGIDRFIQHGSVPAGKNPAVSMPPFGDSNTLTQPEIANIEAYIMGMNGVDRARIINPGMTPRSFFITVLALYILIFLMQGGVRIKKNIK
jgi:ubiquinol-cytochrome c reductase cytochrome b subunit